MCYSSANMTHLNINIENPRDDTFFGGGGDLIYVQQKHLDL